MKKPVKIVALLIISITTLSNVYAKEPALNEPIPVDEKLTRAKLANGLEYFILKNTTPEQKAELRLVVQAGSLNENDNQRGLAHMLEHMAFNGTRHFPKKTLVDNLQRMGVKFGADLNAYTNANETVYILPIPLDEPKNLTTGLQVLEDWAFHMDLKDADIDKERRVVEEEWRLNKETPDAEIRKENLALLFKGSRYAEREPIGELDVIRHAKPELMRDFYRTWYRPDLMSVIVVGDVDVATTQDLIKQRFGPYPNPSQAVQRPENQVPNNVEPLIGIFASKNLPQSDVSITYKESVDNVVDTRVSDYVLSLKHHIIKHLINDDRLPALQDLAHPPFDKASAWRDFLAGEARSKFAYTLYAQTSAGREQEALAALHLESSKIIQHGFTQDELYRAMQTVLGETTNSYNNREKVESADKANEYVRSVVEHETLPSLAWELKIQEAFLPRITLDEINALTRTYFDKSNQIVLINSSQKTANINEQQVRSILDNTPQTQAPIIKNINTKLLPVEPTAGRIVKTIFNKNLNMTTWHLSNGALVELIKTDFNDDKIEFASYSDGGSSMITDDVWRKNRWAFEGLAEAGFAGHSKTELTQLLADGSHTLTIQPGFNNNSQGISGSFAPRDTEVALQMIYGTTTHLNHDATAFKRYVQRGISETQNLAQNRMSAFMDYVLRTINHNNPRYTGSFPNAAAWTSINYDEAYQARKAMFANANGAHFTFVGKINEAQLKPLVEKYIASLPSNLNAKNQFKDLGYREDINGRTIEFKKGHENLSVVLMRVKGDAAYRAEDDLALDAFGEILTLRLNDKLREQGGNVYTVSANGQMHARPFGGYDFSIEFPCAPDKADELIQATQSELTQLIEKGPLVADIEKFKKAALTSLLEQSKTNEYWLAAIQNAYKRGLNPEDILLAQSRIEKLSAADIQNIGQKYLSKKAGVAVLKPE